MCCKPSLCKQTEQQARKKEKNKLQIHKTTAEGFPMAIWCWTPLGHSCWYGVYVSVIQTLVLGWLLLSLLLKFWIWVFFIYFIFDIQSGACFAQLDTASVQNRQCFWCVHFGCLFLQYEGFAGCPEIASSGPLRPYFVHAWCWVNLQYIVNKKKFELQNNFPHIFFKHWTW